jgi:putative nucleotidyltransferase with HDIG domain
VAFTTAYALVNFFLVSYVEWVTSGRSIGDNVARSLEVGVRSFLFYALVVTAVAILVRRDLGWCIPLTLVPVWAIRTGLKQKADLYEQYYETITALNLMLQRAHPYTHAHLERVASSAEEVARKLGLSSGRARLVREAAVLHDVGKIAVDERVLDKPESLTQSELEHVRKHAEWGAEILAPVRQFAPLVPWIRHHHERPDGQGYPQGLRLEQIPMESRIIAVVDAFDAMTDTQDGKPGRAYRDPMSVDEAIAELERNAGTQFDEQVVRAFREVVKGR